MARSVKPVDPTTISEKRALSTILWRPWATCPRRWPRRLQTWSPAADLPMVDKKDNCWSKSQDKSEADEPPRTASRPQALRPIWAPASLQQVEIRHAQGIVVHIYIYMYICVWFYLANRLRTKPNPRTSCRMWCVALDWRDVFPLFEWEESRIKPDRKIDSAEFEKNWFICCRGWVRGANVKYGKEEKEKTRTTVFRA